MPTVRVRVQPGASRDQVNEYRDGVLRVRVTAPPREGRANAAAVTLLAKFLDLPVSQLRIIRGQASRDKLIEVEKLDEADLRGRLERLKKRSGE